MTRTVGDRMASALKAVLWLSLGGWIGALTLFAFGVAPLAFTVLPSTELAAKLVGPLLMGLNLYGIAAGIGLAAIAADYGVIAVGRDAPWQSFDELIQAWRRAPSAIVAAGGSAVGGQDHMKLLVLAREAGIDPRAIRYVPFDGGGEAVTALLGGFVAVVPLDVSEVLRLFEAGEVRVLATLSPQRLDAPFDAVPTARELGYDVCRRCGYWLRGLSDTVERCPECGHERRSDER